LFFSTHGRCADISWARNRSGKSAIRVFRNFRKPLNLKHLQILFLESGERMDAGCEFGSHVVARR